MKHEELHEKLKEINSALGKEGVMVCIYKGEDSNAGVFMSGTNKNIVSSLALALQDDIFRKYIMHAAEVNHLVTTMLPKIFGAEENKENTQQEADRIVKDFLRNNGFKMEGE